jgi:hypothetical protein
MFTLTDGMFDERNDWLISVRCCDVMFADAPLPA